MVTAYGRGLEERKCSCGRDDLNQTYKGDDKRMVELRGGEDYRNVAS